MALEGLVNNKFTVSLKKINKANLPTLALRDSGAYETIKDRKIRDTLVVSGLLQIDTHRSGADRNLEICWDTRIDSSRLLRAIIELTEDQKLAIKPTRGWSKQPYKGREATKVFLWALQAVISEIREDGGKRFNELHKIAHGRERRYGTPLDEIRICNWIIIESLKRAIEKMRKNLIDCSIPE